MTQPLSQARREGSWSTLSLLTCLVACTVGCTASPPDAERIQADLIGRTLIDQTRQREWTVRSTTEFKRLTTAAVKRTEHIVEQEVLVVLDGAGRSPQGEDMFVSLHVVYRRTPEGWSLALLDVREILTAAEKDWEAHLDAVQLTVDRLAALGTALNSYHIDHGSYPPVTSGASAETLRSTLEPAYLRSLQPNDGWENPILLFPDKRSGELFLLSTGADSSRDAETPFGATSTAEEDLLFSVTESGGGYWLSWPAPLAHKMRRLGGH